MCEGACRDVCTALDKEGKKGEDCECRNSATGRLCFGVLMFAPVVLGRVWIDGAFIDALGCFSFLSLYYCVFRPRLVCGGNVARLSWRYDLKSAFEVVVKMQLTWSEVVFRDVKKGKGGRANSQKYIHLFVSALATNYCDWNVAPLKEVQQPVF